MIQEVAPGVFAATQLAGANVGLIKTRCGAVLVDSPWLPQQARAWSAEVQRLCPDGVAYRVHTDYHLDHILGACFLPAALTIAHETAWKHLRALDHDALVTRVLEQAQGRFPDLTAQLAGVHIVLPQMTLGSSMTLWCDRAVEIVHFGGHTPATLGVYLPQERVLFAGDLIVNGCHPYVGDAVSRQWLESLQRVRAMDVKVIVPGHGSPGGPEMVEPLYNYLKDMRTRVEACFRAGHTRRETVERVKPIDAFPVPPGDDERLRRMLRSSVERVYDEIKKDALRSRQRSQS